MSIKDTLKSYFVTGATPTQSQFSDLIDFIPDAEGVVFGEATGTNTYVATSSATITGYTTGLQIGLLIDNTNTVVGPTININGLGAIALVKNGTTPLTIGDLVSGQVYGFIFDGTNFQLLGAVAQSGGGSTPAVATVTDLETGTDNVKTASALGLAGWWTYLKATASQFILAFLAGTGNRMVQVDPSGNLTANYQIITLYVTDTDILTAITGATYNSGNSFTTAISPANSKIFLQGQRYSSGAYIYEAVGDNIAARITLG